jgi:hypothetical protein
MMLEALSFGAAIVRDSSIVVCNCTTIPLVGFRVDIGSVAICTPVLHIMLVSKLISALLIPCMNNITASGALLPPLYYAS